jgi:hypothetical protein
MTIIEQMQELDREHTKVVELLRDQRERGDIRGYEETEQRMTAVGNAHNALRIELCSKPRESNI